MEKNYVLSVLFVLISILAFSQVPQKMSIQGLLTDEEGNAYPDDTYALTFRLYTTPISGIIAWSETQNVDVNNSLFNTLIGEISPLNIAFNQTYYLGISVNGGPELEPRIELASSPYSLMTQTVAPGGILPGSLSENSVDIDNIIPNIISSINGVSNDGGNINLVAGSNIVITPNDITNSITISAADQGAGNPGILQVNPGNAIDVSDRDGPTSTISVLNNSINDDEIVNNSLTSLSLAAGSVGNSELQDNSITTNKVVPNIISSIDGVSNDGGNVNFVAGANMTIIPDNVNNTITFSSAGPGNGNPGILRINPGNAIGVSDVDGPTSTISVLANSIGSDELQADVEFGPAGFVGIRNPNNRLVTGLSYNIFGGGYLGLSNSGQVEVVRLSNDVFGSGTVEVFNRNGQLMADMFATDNEGVVSTYNNIGSQVSVLSSFRNSGFVGIADPNGNPLAVMEANPLLNGSFTIVNDQGNLVAQVTEDGFDNGFIGVSNSTELPIVSMYADPSGNGLFQLGNNATLLSLELGVNNNGGGLMHIYNTNQQIAARITEDNGSGFISISDQNNNELAVLHQNLLGDGSLEILNNGARVAQVTEDGFGNGFIGVGNSNEMPLVSMYGDDRGNGILQLENNLGQLISELTSDSRDGGRLNIYSSQSTGAARIGVTSTNHGYFSSYNQNEIDIAGIGPNTNGDGFVYINNNSGSELGVLTSNIDNGGYFSLSDGFGIELAIIDAIPGTGGHIGIANGAGVVVADLQPGFDGGILRTRSNSGNILTFSGPNISGRGYLGIMDEFEVPKAQLTTNPDGSGAIESFNIAGSLVSVMQTNFQEGGRISVLNSNTIEQALMTTVTDGGYIAINNASGTDIARMQSNTAGAGSVSIDNTSGTTVGRLTSSSQGNGWINVNNTSGTEMARMRALTGGGTFEAFNAFGTEVATVTFSSEDNGYIGVNSASGSLLARLTGGSNDGGYLGINNSNEQTAGFINTNSDGSGNLELNNANGSTSVLLTTFNNKGYIANLAANGQVLCSLGSTTDNDGYIRLNNQFGERRANITTNVNGGGFVGVSDSNGTNRSWLSTLNTNVGVVSTLGPNGTQNVLLSNSGAVGPNGGAMWIYDDAGTLRAASTANGFVAVYGPNGNRNAVMGGDPSSPNHGDIEVYDTGGNVQAEMFINGSGLGVINADIKNFNMDDPEDDSKEIWYASLEGPEAGAYTRGTAELINGEAWIELPDHFSKVANDQGITVHLTPLSANSEGLAVIEKNSERIHVKELRNGIGNYSFDFIVHAIRTGFEDYKVVRQKRAPIVGYEPPLNSVTIPSNELQANRSSTSIGNHSEKDIETTEKDQKPNSMTNSSAHGDKKPGSSQEIGAINRSNGKWNENE
jgi:hypothetical protein